VARSVEPARDTSTLLLRGRQARHRFNGVQVPKVSVIVPVYNRAHYLGTTLDTLLTQTFRDYEILVVDDGSSDAIGDVMARHGHRVRYLRQDNAGPAAARNLGIESTDSRYIAFVDSDDLWLPHRLEAGVTALDHEQGTGLWCSAVRQIDAAGRPARSARRHLRGHSGNVFEPLLLGCFVNSPTVLARRQAFDQLGPFDASLPLYEDWDMWLHLARHYRVRFSRAVTALYRIHDGQLSQPRLNAAAQREQAGRRVLNKAIAAGVPEPLRRQALGRMCVRTAYWHLLEQRTADVHRCLQEAAHTDPAQRLSPYWLALAALSHLPAPLRRHLRLQQLHQVL